MAKKSPSVLFLILLLISSISACQQKPNSNSNNIVGVWVGESQWQCGHGDPVWSTTIEFKSDGSLTSTLSILTAPQSIGNGTWSLSENNIEVKFPPKTTWTGTVSNGKMEGTMKSDDDACVGSWSLTKK